jgi:hypothetical protein
LDRWYDTQNNSIDEYYNKVICGMIKMDGTRPNWDWLPCSGGFTGNFEDIIDEICEECFSGNCSGNIIGELSGQNLIYTVDENNNILILT